MTSRNELEQLQEPLRALEVQSQIKQARVERLTHQLQEATKEQAVVNHEYRKHLIYYARKDCLQLAQAMHQKLPAEIRDFVYECLCVEPDQPIPVGPYYHFRKYDQPLHDPLEKLSNWGPQIRWPDLSRRYVDPNSYAAHIGSVVTDDVEMGDAPETGAANDGVDQVKDSRELDGSRIAVDPELAERIEQMNVGLDMEDININDDSKVLPDGRVKVDHSKKPSGDIVLPGSHFLNPRYVGPAIAYDIQKVYYARNTFSICTVEDAIFRFLTLHTSHSFQMWVNGRPPNVPRDLHLGLTQIKPFEHIRRLQIRVKFEDFLAKMPAKASADERGAYERNFLRFVKRNLSGLDVFLSRCSKQELDIEFVLMTALPDMDDVDIGWDTQCNWINFLQSVRNRVYTMKYDCNATIRVTHHDDGISPFPRNLTGLFALTKEQWEYEKSVNDGSVETWGSHFYLAFPLNANQEPDVLPIGFSGREQDQLMRERWGINGVLDTQPTHPIKEGKYWPKGNRSSTWQDHPER